MAGGGGLFEAVGSIAGSAIQAGAIKKATKMQIEALEKARDFVFTQLEPNKVNAQASAADILRAKQRLKYQGKIDPALLQARYEGEKKLLEATQQIGKAGSDEIAALAQAEAIKGGPAFEGIKQRLIDTAIKEIDSGATLPPDVQAELVKAGLERAGSVTNAPGSVGFGGNIVRKLIGTEAIKLQADRQQRAAALATAAQNLETSRANILGQLFPNLQRQQLQNMEAGAKAVATSEAMKPEVGLSGGDVAQLWAARVGAANNLNIRAAEAAGSGAQSLAGVWSNAIGAGTRGVSPVLNNLFTPKPTTPNQLDNALLDEQGWY